MEERLSTNKAGIVVAIIIALFIVAGSILAYWLITHSADDKNNVMTNSTDTAKNQVDLNGNQQRDVPSGMKLYTNSDYRFTALYPETWPVISSAKTEKIGSTEVTRLSFNLYRTDTKINEESLFVLFMKKDSKQQAASDYLNSHFNPPSKTSWEEGDSSFAGGSRVLQLSGFDNPGEIGDLPYTGPYVETPDKQYVVFLVYPQEKDPYLTNVFGGAAYTMSDFLNSWRWY